MTNSDEFRIEIDESAYWTSVGGHYRSGSRPTRWRKKQSGAWDRKELISYGKASANYREDYYRCPECDARLLPTNVRYRFGCEGCSLVFGTGWDGLWGYPLGHEKAMHLGDPTDYERSSRVAIKAGVALALDWDEREFGLQME